ncbi:transmembrane protein FAM155B-like [Lacerta agilis]|uniref:transmembrane protein FAM155B-like n=1 Tax=Lacerta agilis TaxID=80427 RepID=UPI00141A3C26|nr:transmembrane protein FAM155B-like [Lacerta agilis]
MSKLRSTLRQTSAPLRGRPGKKPAKAKWSIERELAGQDGDVVGRAVTDGDEEEDCCQVAGYGMPTTRCRPCPPDKPCADSERPQKWRLSLASFLFFTVLLSDSLWLCAIAAGAQLGAQDRSVSWPEVAVMGSDDGQAPTARPCLNLSSACSQRHLLQGPPGVAFPAARAEASPSQLAFLERHFRVLRLPFCEAYTVWDLLLGMADPESLDCSLRSLLADVAAGGARRGEACSGCLEAYQRLDQHAQEKYYEFEELLEKYLQFKDYSVCSCLRECKAVYKAWLCSEYFNVTQLQCQHRIPCNQYCLEVQTRCPFVLPDNGELIYGGLPGFICTGLLESNLPEQEAKCCDMRWDSCNHHPDDSCNTSAKSKSESFHDQRRDIPHHHHHVHHHHQQQQHYNLYYHHTQYQHQHHPSLLPVSAGSHLTSGKIRFCVLVLMLLHTMVSFSSVPSSVGLSLGALPAMDETLTRDKGPSFAMQGKGNCQLFFTSGGKGAGCINALRPVVGGDIGLGVMYTDPPPCRPPSHPPEHLITGTALQ